MDSLDQQIIDEINFSSACLSQHPHPDLYGSAAFWEALAEKHRNLIKEHGFRRFKRTINFEYHQWQVLSLRDWKISKLISRLLEQRQIPYGILFTRIDSRAVADINEIRSNPYLVFMGLLWQYALLNDHLGCLDICQEPQFGEPLPVTYKGGLISQDLATSALELNRIAQCIDMSKVKRVAEIGAGYGRLAHMVTQRFPEISYCIFDIPPALVVAQNYLTQVLGPAFVGKFQEQVVVPELASKRRISAYLPHQLESFPDDYFDLVINISSFDEMDRKQVDNYFSLIDRKGSGSLYVKGHDKAPAWCSVSGGGITELPYRSNWELLYDGPDPFSVPFVERIYSLRPQHGSKPHKSIRESQR